MSRTSRVLCAVAVIAGCATVGAAHAAPSGRQCFRMSEMQGWRATPDARSFYMRVRTSDIYRVDLASACPALRRGNVHLVTAPITDLVCSAVEFDLKVADNGLGHVVTPCIVSGFTRLSPEDAKALPRDVRP